MSEPDPFSELGRELRQGAGEEFRADAEEGERLAAQGARRKAGLADVARDAMMRGDRVVLQYRGHQVVGAVTHAAGDLATIQTAEGLVHGYLGGEVVFSVAERDATEGRTPEFGVDSFRARLFELELAEAQVEVRGAVVDGAVRGRVAVVATDHLVLATDVGTLHIGLSAIDCVAERT